MTGGGQRAGRKCALLIVSRHFVLHIPQQSDPHFRSIVSPKDIADIVCFHLHLYLSDQVSGEYTTGLLPGKSLQSGDLQPSLAKEDL